MEKQIAKQGTTPNSLIELAISNNADIDKLEKLMELQERWEAKQAKKAFLKALSEFQSTVPELVKSKKVSFGQGKTNYKYATLGEITQQIKQSLTNCGLSYRWQIQDESNIKVTCIVSHIDGHAEQTTMSGVADSSGSKNPIQARASTITYLQRYTLIGALGISTADGDTDAIVPKKNSKQLLKEAKQVIDKDFNAVDVIEALGRPLIKKTVANGLNSTDKKTLEAYLSNKYTKLKNEVQN